jgi:hypothetical protein
MRRKRDYKHEYGLQKERGEHENRMERQRARREIDKKDTGTITKKSPRRAGKDVSHNKMMMDGGKNSDGYKLESPSKNRSRNGGTRRKPGGGKKRK